MSDPIHDMTGQGRTMKEFTEAVLKSGGGDGTFDGMEPRLARLEAHMEHAQADLSVLKTDMGLIKDRLARLEVRVEHLPGKGFIVVALLGSLAVITALITFQDQIQALIK